MTNKTTIYDHHAKAFSRVSAWIILNEWNEKVATVAIKFPQDGAGRLYAYVHWIGLEMVRGFSGGYGYDKRSAAVESAASLIETINDDNQKKFKEALRLMGGKDWHHALIDAGFTVLQAV